MAKSVAELSSWPTSELRPISERLGALVIGGMRKQPLAQPINCPNIKCNYTCIPKVSKECKAYGNWCSLVKGHDSQHMCMPCRQWTINNREELALPATAGSPPSETEYRLKHRVITHEGHVLGVSSRHWTATREVQTHAPASRRDRHMGLAVPYLEGTRAVAASRPIVHESGV